MIKDHQKFRLPDARGEHHIDAEVNWNDDPEIKDCKVIRLTMADGKHAFLKREDLNQILFAIGDEEDQRALIPQTLVTVHWRETVLQVKATKDIRKGEQITFPIKMSIPCSNVKQIIGDRHFKKGLKEAQAKESKTTILKP